MIMKAVSFTKKGKHINKFFQGNLMLHIRSRHGKSQHHTICPTKSFVGQIWFVFAYTFTYVRNIIQIKYNIIPVEK